MPARGCSSFSTRFAERKDPSARSLSFGRGFEPGLAAVSGMSMRELQARFRDFYARPLSIEQLNAERARLDQLKEAVRARWLKALAPEVRARVWVVSDVLPFGPRVVGSGPFWDGKIRHRVVADNRAWVEGLARSAARGVCNRTEPQREAGTHRQEWTEWVSCVELEAGLRSLRGLSQDW